MHHVREQRLVHFFHRRPIRTVHILHIQIVALVSPALVEDLFEFVARVDEGTQYHIQMARASGRRCLVRVDEIQPALRTARAIQ